MMSSRSSSVGGLRLDEASDRLSTRSAGSLPNIQEQPAPQQVIPFALRAKPKASPYKHLRLSPLQWGHPNYNMKSAMRAAMDYTVSKANDPKWSTDLKEYDKAVTQNFLRVARTSASVPGSMSPDSASVLRLTTVREERARSMREVALGGRTGSTGGGSLL